MGIVGRATAREAARKGLAILAVIASELPKERSLTVRIPRLGRVEGSSARVQSAGRHGSRPRVPDSLRALRRPARTLLCVRPILPAMEAGAFNVAGRLRVTPQHDPVQYRALYLGRGARVSKGVARQLGMDLELDGRAAFTK